MGLWARIKQTALTDVTVLVKGVDRDALDEVERVLIEADFGSRAFEVVNDLEDRIRRGELKTEGALRTWLADELVGMFGGEEGREFVGLASGDRDGPVVILMVGVNGVGKTTQAAKLAKRLLDDSRSVLLAAADTFRAGASEQLSIWAERLGVPVVTGTQGGDPAAVAHDAVDAATARGIDVVIVDTAGRLHTEQDLMSELQKMVRVVGRRCVGAPHEILLVLDGTVGQNGLQQGKAFSSAVPVTGLVVTKLDGTAKGGAVVAAQREVGAPVRFVGVGEGLDDLEDFDPRRFVERMLGD